MRRLILSAKDLDFTVSREGLCTATEYCQHVMQSLIIWYIHMGTLDRQEGLNYYGKRQGICKCHG
jgi:hypothetical protein